MTESRSNIPPDRTPPRRPGGRPAAFTLTELLVVISIIVLMLALAVPLFNVMHGGQSIEAGQNTVSAMLQRARARAIGVQERRGVFFFDDQGTGKTGMLMVRLLDTTPVTLELDQDNVEIEYLPKGIGTAFVLPPVPATPNSTEFKPCGLIMFDGIGRVENLTAFKLKPAAAPGTNLFQQFGRGPNIEPTVFGSLGVPAGPSDQSHAAFVLYDRRPFADQGAPPNAYSFSQAQKDWLDQNAVAVVVNRYNGTLIRGDRQ